MRDEARAWGLCLAVHLRAAPLLTLLSAALVAAQYAAAPVSTYGVALVVDGVTGSGSAVAQRGVVVIAVAYACFHLLASVGEAVSGILDDRVHGTIHTDLLALTAGIPGIAHHEDPRVADQLALVRDGARDMAGGSWLLVSGVANLVTAGTVVVLLARVQPVLLVLVPLSGLRVWASRAGGRRRRDGIERGLPWIRRADALALMASEARRGLEVRVLGLATRLAGVIGLARTRVARERDAAERRAAALETGVRGGLALIQALAILWLTVRAAHGQASPGDVALLVLLSPQIDRATGAVAGTVRDLASITHLFGHYAALRRYARAHGWSTGVEPAPAALGDGIRLSHVTFRYPGADRPALSDVDLFLPAGTTVALVGDNGAGKSTLVKLLARLYDPSDGQITVDGRDLREIDPVSWRRRVSAAFQDFARFEFTARESVGVGDLARLDDDGAVHAALRRGGAQAVVNRLPAGLDTQLGIRFADGTDLSQGQWQRLALARAFMRSHPLVLLLDEPTSALDPAAEQALVRTFTDNARQAANLSGAVTVVVTHRMSTARAADLVVLLERGRIVEVGRHEDLLAGGGRYAGLYDVQARAYR